MKVSDIYEEKKDKFLRVSEFTDALQENINSVSRIETKFGDKILIETKTGKKVLISKTSAFDLKSKFGDDTDGWLNKNIKIQKVKQNINGVIKDTIYVEGV